ncbi:MAG: hypothetical protein RLZZ11_2110 [Cyanobacteriota bacterium]
MERTLLAVYSFYREDPELLRGLDPLWACRVSRGWSGLRIECRDQAHRAVVCGVINLVWCDRSAAAALGGLGSGA